MKILYVFLNFQKNWSSISMVILQIITDCSIFDRFCFWCIVCLFSSFYGLYCVIWIVKMIGYSRNHVRKIINLVLTVYLSGDLLSYTNGAYEFSVKFCVVKFSSFGKVLMDYEIRSGKSLSLGMPKAPQGNIQGQPRA